MVIFIISLKVFNFFFCNQNTKTQTFKGNEKIRDVVNGAMLFVSRPDAKRFFFQPATNASIPADFQTPGKYHFF